MSPGLRVVQERLNANGFGPIKVDGLWGDETKAALERALPHAPLGAAPRVDETLLRQLQRDEGYRSTAYPDPLSALGQACARLRLDPTEYKRVPRWSMLSGTPWTIGYGFTAGVKEGDTITQHEASLRLVEEMLRHNDIVAAKLPWLSSLDPARRRVVQNMHYNMGWGTLSGFKNTLPAIQRGDYRAAAAGMESSLWASQVGDRAKRLVATMRDGVDR